jgi:hypothetical protein
VISPEALATLLVAALGATGLPAPVVAAVSALALPIARLLVDLIERHQAGAPLPTLIAPEPVRDLDIVAGLGGAGISPVANTLPPPPADTAPQDLDEPALAWGPSEAPTTDLNAPTRNSP